MKDKPKIIVILGPTASGKSDIAIKLAKKFNGEIISADSRQIYREMDISTGKVDADKIVPHSPTPSPARGRGWLEEPGEGNFYSKGIPHYMIDIISPKTKFSAAQFKKKVDKIIPAILKRGKNPIICGGTGFWIKAIVDNMTYPEVRPDWKLRNKLRNKKAQDLFRMLKKLDPQRAKSIDKNNKVRLIRAIEICGSIGKVPALSCNCERNEAISRLPQSLRSFAMTNKYEFLQIGISLPKEKLQKNIKKRLKQRFEAGMIEEVKKLKKQGLSWKKIQSFGLGYFWIPLYLQNKLSYEKLFENVYSAEKDYAKRQMTWFKKDERIVWLKNYKEIEKEAMLFIKK
jgi:tRNA dimethylallyltransferase